MKHAGLTIYNIDGNVAIGKGKIRVPLMRQTENGTWVPVDILSYKMYGWDYCDNGDQALEDLRDLLRDSNV